MRTFLEFYANDKIIDNKNVFRKPIVEIIKEFRVAIVLRNKPFDYTFLQFATNMLQFLEHYGEVKEITIQDISRLYALHSTYRITDFDSTTYKGKIKDLKNFKID